MDFGQGDGCFCGIIVLRRRTKIFQLLHGLLPRPFTAIARVADI